MATQLRAVPLTRGELMHLAMSRAGLDAASMAPLLHVNRKTLGRWVRDETVPNPIILERFAEICGVPVDWFTPASVTDNDGDDPGGSRAALTSTNAPRRLRARASKGRKPSTSERDSHSYRDSPTTATATEVAA